MTSVTQVIPNYDGGINQQADERKFPGQVKDCINAMPHTTLGLHKRPGSKRVGTTALANVQTSGSFFHYFRDETEGSYIGQVDTNGEVRMWKCSDGTQVGVDYDTAGQALDSSDADHASITSYLTPSTVDGVKQTEDIQALTINDTTFLTNRSKTVSTTGTTTAAPHTYFAYIEILRTENGRQYGLNIHDPDITTETDVRTATRIKIKDDNLYEGGGSGGCPGIGTQVFAASTVATETPNIATSSVDTTNDTITVTGHGFTTGDRVKYRTGPSLTNSGTVLGNFTDDDVTPTEYFVRSVDANTIKLADTAAKAASSDSADHRDITGTGNNDQFFTTELNRISIKNQAGTRLDGSTKRENLIFRITSQGQQGQTGNYGDDDSEVPASAFSCAYQRTITLLHGGEGWEVGDKATVLLDHAKTSYRYEVEVEKIETSKVKATINSGVNGIIRPEPTPFDADTAVTADSILGGLNDALAGTGLSTTIIGNGIYIYSNSQKFNIEVVNNDIMRVMQSETNNVGDLPIQCKHGYIVKVANAQMSDEDDYYLKFEGENGKDGAGSWVECAKPGIVAGFNATTMPHILQRQGDGTFLVKKATWADREVGDDITNQAPSFCGDKNDADPAVYDQNKKINKVLFFRNRLCFLSDENIITSRAGDLFNFWANTALTVSATDPIDISCSSTFPSQLFDGIELTAGLLVFSTNQQFLLASDDTIFNPDTAKLRAIASYNYNKLVPPISLGPTKGFLDNTGKYSRFLEIMDIRREAEPVVADSSLTIPKLLPKEVDILTVSRENGVVALGKSGEKNIYLFRHITLGDKRQQQAWFKWTFNQESKYFFIVNDELYYLDKNSFLQKINIVPTEEDPSITKDSIDYLIHLDNWVTVTGGTYSSDTNKTTFTDKATWIPSITSSDKLVLVDIDASTTRVGRYSEVTLTANTPNDDFTVPGDWSTGTHYLGYLYDYQIDLPRIYVTRSQGERSSSDTRGSLVIHRLKFSFGRIGVYKTILTRLGKDNYEEEYESTIADTYHSDSIPYLDEDIRTIPVYEKNENVDITLKSTHPAPATLRSLSWEGEYSPKYYRRV